VCSGSAVQCGAVPGAVSAGAGEPLDRRGVLRLVQRRQPVHDLGVLEPDGGCIFRHPGDPAFALIAAGGAFGSITGPC